MPTKDRIAALTMAALGLIFVSLTPSLINRVIQGVPLETLLSEASAFVLLTWTVGLLALIGFFMILVTMGVIEIKNKMGKKR